MSKLKSILKLRKIRQVDIAKATGISCKTVHRSCALGIKTVRIAKRYAAALNCDWRDLLD